MSLQMADTRLRRPLVATLGPEWDRMQALVEIAVSHRANATVPDESLARLRQASALVKNVRAGGAWQAVERVAGVRVQDAPLLYDALTVALVPHVRPSVAFGLMTLNHAGQGQVAPTTGALYEILALDGAEDGDFLDAIRRFDALSPTGLTRVGGEAPLRELHPGTKLGQIVFEIDEPLETPPGVVRLTQGTSLDRLVLPDRTRARIEDVLAGSRFNEAIRERGESAGGPIVLLAGPPGTGKTLAAQAMAAALSRPLFRIDFGLVMSKWVGETEKNLSRIFETLHGLGAALLIDEADALLGKRVLLQRDGRDGHANTLTGHMLARFERHDGLVFLTSNLSENMDDAYFRRLNHVIGFERPKRAARSRIWSLHVPESATGPDRQSLLDLAAGVRLTGGEIANAAINARAFAHRDGTPVAASHLAKAAWQEITKVPRTVRLDDLAGLATHLPSDGGGSP